MLLSAFFNKSSDQILEQFYQNAAQNAQWVSLAVNKNTVAGSMLTKELEIRNGTDAFSLKIAATKNGFIHQLWQNKQSLTTSLIEENSSLLKSYNALTDELIEAQLVHFQTMLNNALNTKTYTTALVATEDKALEWMRVSFQILEKAIIQSLTTPDLLFQVLLFMGKNPNTQQQEIRLILFNLDIKFELLENGSLRIRIYNDKAQEYGSSKKASLEGDFDFRKREMLDELTRIISVLSAGIKLT